jgi:iron complex transport system permease protein
MFLVATAPVDGLHSVLWWMLGNLQPVSRELLGCSAVIILIGCSAAWFWAAELNALTLGEEVAHHVGLRPHLVSVLGLGLATLVTAAAVGMAGLIGFVGLIVPHALRSVVGPDHRRLIPAAAVGGGVFLAVCDGLARTLIAPVEIPVGVVTALCGGPFFLVILRRRRRSGWIG